MKKTGTWRTAVFAMLTSLAASTAAAQDHHEHREHSEHRTRAASDAGSSSNHQGYTAAERAEGLRKGRGMGLALAAESNGYPGPLHVLELADALKLTAGQRDKTQLLFDQMQERASTLGEKLLREEAALNMLFADRRASRAELVRLVTAAAQTEAELKITHLETHLAMMNILSSIQVAQYVELRRSGGGSGRTRPSASSW
jgi:hypothetical protein